MKAYLHRTVPVLAIVLALAASAALTACAAPVTEDDTSPVGESGATPKAVVIGTLATQDSLPLWVAEDAGYFTAQGIPSVEIVTFQSAQECQAALVAGSVDALMSDLIVAAKLHAAGTEVVVPTVMLGADVAEGRFAIVAAPGSGITSMSGLSGVPVGTAAGTITEYVLDALMAEAGVAPSDVVKEEVPKMPVRFQLLMEGTLKAASLPEPFVSLALGGGATVVEGGDDTLGAENISQSVLVVSREFVSGDAGAATLEALLGAWDQAVADINAAPDDYRAALVEHANLPEALAESYAVSTYPSATPPEASQVQAVLDWMSERGYLTSPVTPADVLPGR